MNLKTPEDVKALLARSIVGTEPYELAQALIDALEKIASLEQEYETEIRVNTAHRDDKLEAWKERDEALQANEANKILIQAFGDRALALEERVDTLEMQKGAIEYGWRLDKEKLEGLKAKVEANKCKYADSVY